MKKIMYRDAIASALAEEMRQLCDFTFRTTQELYNFLFD